MPTIDPSSPTIRPSRAAWITSASLAVLAASWWGRGLGEPAGAYWDEGFYVTDARRLFHPGALLDNPEHPPLGKWLIGLGIAVTGDHAIGWRVASLLCAVALVALLPLALEPMGLVGPRTPRWVLTVPSLVLLVDPLAYTTARIALLDAPLVLLFVASALALVVSRRAGLDPRHARGMRIAAGLLAGLALGTKWTALTLLPIFCLAHVRWEPPHVRLDTRALAEILVPLCLSYLACFAIPGATSFAPHAFPQVDGPLDPSLPWPVRVVALHARMVRYHTYYFQNPMRSAPYEWLLGRQPVWYALRVEGEGLRAIVACGSPLSWIALELATLASVARAIRQRAAAPLMLGAFALVQLAFWSVVLRMTFVYYMSAILPFLALATAWLVAQLLEERDPPRRVVSFATPALVALVLVAGAAWHAHTLPLLRGDALTEAELRAYERSSARAFLFHDAMPLDELLRLARAGELGAARIEPILE